MAKRLTEKNLNNYLIEIYRASLSKERKKIINNISPILQKEYGEDYDCSLVSITTILSWLCPTQSIKQIYKKVEDTAKDYFYNGKKIGTLPFFIKPIYNKILKYFKVDKISSVRYLKNIGFNFNFIKEQIDNNNPLILSMYSDGRNYYKNHSVVIIGYNIITLKNNDIVKMLLIYDNWYKDIAYIDYNKLNLISGINF